VTWPGGPDGWSVRRRVRWHSIGLLLVLIVVAFVPAPARQAGQLSSAALGTAHPRVGEPCQRIQRYPVSLAMDANGTWVASFAFAGGTAQGHVQLPSMDSRVIAESDAFVADARLGSYERADLDDQHSELMCKANPTYHFYCLATGVIDQFCLEWVHRDLRIKLDVVQRRDARGSYYLVWVGVGSGAVRDRARAGPAPVRSSVVRPAPGSRLRLDCMS
jgi:hypothetical protein